jgi:hypothetical protein
MSPSPTPDIDPRLDPARGGFDTPGEDFQVTAGVACLRRTPEGDGRLETQALHGDTIRIYGERDGFGWGRMASDGYVGWVDMDALSFPVLPVTHRVSALRTYVFTDPDLKSAPRFLLSMNARVVGGRREGRFVECARAGWVVADHLGPLTPDEDPASVAERFLHAPYQWGGKESLGLDCSGLVQMAWAAAGQWAPRDSDMQRASLGTPLDISAGLPPLQRNDLVFWKGHVGLMLDAQRLIHANAHHMATAIEPLDHAIARIQAESGPVLAVRRPEPFRTAR